MQDSCTACAPAWCCRPGRRCACTAARPSPQHRRSPPPATPPGSRWRPACPVPHQGVGLAGRGRVLCAGSRSQPADLCLHASVSGASGINSMQLRAPCCQCRPARSSCCRCPSVWSGPCPAVVTQRVHHYTGVHLMLLGCDEQADGHDSAAAQQAHDEGGPNDVVGVLHSRADALAHPAADQGRATIRSAVDMHSPTYGPPQPHAYLALCSLSVQQSAPCYRQHSSCFRSTCRPCRAALLPRRCQWTRPTAPLR